MGERAITYLPRTDKTPRDSEIFVIKVFVTCKNGVIFDAAKHRYESVLISNTITPYVSDNSEKNTKNLLNHKIIQHRQVCRSMNKGAMSGENK